MASISAKIFEIFRNLKPDAIPRPPRPETEGFRENENQENYDNVDQSSNKHGGIDPDDYKKDKKKPTFNNKFFNPNKKKDSFGPNKGDKEHDCCSTNSNVNVHATGNVINIVNSRDVHCGKEIVYYMAPTNGQQKQTKEDDDYIDKNNIIMLLLDATIKVRYKLLLDWVRNDEDGTLGKLTTQLWEEGERQLVKELSIIYKKNKK